MTMMIAYMNLGTQTFFLLLWIGLSCQPRANGKKWWVQSSQDKRIVYRCTRNHHQDKYKLGTSGASLMPCSFLIHNKNPMSLSWFTHVLIFGQKTSQWSKSAWRRELRIFTDPFHLLHIPFLVQSYWDCSWHMCYNTRHHDAHKVVCQCLFPFA